MRIDSSGNVGIGTTSPTEPLTVSETASGSTTQIVSLVNPVGAASTGVRLWMSGTNTTTRGTFIDAVAESTSNNHSLRFGTSASSAAPTERMRIDSSGNLLVGTTDTLAYNAGTRIAQQTLNVTSTSTTSTDYIGYFNRQSSDGTILQFGKANSPVGTIGSVSSVSIYIHGGAGYSGLTFGNDELLPCDNTGATRDAAIDLGDSSGRFKDLYLSGNALADNFVGTSDTDTFIAMTGSD